MMIEYTEDMFKEDKKDMLEWLKKNWIYNTEYSSFLGNILFNLKGWIELIKRNKAKSE